MLTVSICSSICPDRPKLGAARKQQQQGSLIQDSHTIYCLWKKQDVFIISTCPSAHLSPNRHKKKVEKKARMQAREGTGGEQHKKEFNS